MKGKKPRMRIKLTRRQVIHTLFATAAFGVTTRFITGCSLSNAKQQTNSGGANFPGKRPNILFIAIDDLRPQLGCYGHKQMVTPNIDRLASEGLLFKRTYCQIPICGASRVSVLTGFRPTRKRLNSYKTKKDKDLPNIESLPGLLKKQDYRTLSRGKIYHVMNDDKDSWSEPDWRPQGGFIGKNAYLNSDNLPVIEANNDFGPPFEVADVSDDAYFDGQVAEKVISDLNRLQGSDKPFFLAAGFVKPHLPFNAPKKYWDIYQEENIDLADNPFRPKNFPETTIGNWAGLRKFASIPEEGPLSDESARKLIHGYYACISYVDAQVGKILNELKQLGLQDNTIIVLWGDHGYHLGEHGHWEKHALFEITLHSPLIVKVPGLDGGKTTNALTEFVDIYPSLCQLCNVPLPDHLEGKSFVPLLNNPNIPWKEAVFSRYKDGVSIKTNRYRYTEYSKLRWPQRLGIEGPAYARMLYDHSIDPDENINIAKSPQNKKIIETLKEMI